MELHKDYDKGLVVMGLCNDRDHSWFILTAIKINTCKREFDMRSDHYLIINACISKQCDECWNEKSRLWSSSQERISYFNFGGFVSSTSKSMTERWLMVHIYILSDVDFQVWKRIEWKNWDYINENQYLEDNNTIMQ